MTSPTNPFSHVTLIDPNITDPNNGGIDTLLITFSGGGALTDGADFGGTRTLSGSNGSYTLTGTHAAITAELDALSFNGAPTTNFTLSEPSIATVAVSFTDGADGAFPQAVLISDAAGNLFGTTSDFTQNFRAGNGAVCEIPNTGTASAPVYGTLTTLWSFRGGADGAFPLSGLIRDAAGDLFGTTASDERADQAQAKASLEQAVRLLAQGDPKGALRAASEACHRAPDQAQAHYAYGQAWTALGEPARAEQAFAAAIQLRPGWPDAWVNYGLARYKQGALGDAKVAMGRALAADPNHAVATANLGAFMRIFGEHESAELLLRAALRRDPGNAGARLNLVADLLQEERAADALALLDEAAPPLPPHPARHWHLQRALALVQTGRTREAHEALGALDALGPTPPELLPLRHWRHVLIALSEGNSTLAQAEARALETALATMGPSAVLEHRIMAHYDLAKFWSGQGEHSQAFAQWAAGHELLKSIQPFSRGEAKAFADAAIATFTAERFATGPRARNDDPTPVFIVGMPRSGTTLCEQIIAAHARAHGAGERSALGNLYHRLGGRETADGVARIAALPQETLDAAANGYLADLCALAPDKSRILDKMPGNYHYVWLIALLFPKARIIHCTRDPRDTGLSIFTFRFHGDHGYAHDLADLGWAIGEQDRLMTHAKTTLPNPVLTIKLSDWVYDFDGTLARVLAHLDLPPDSRCARFYEAENRVRTVSRRQVRQPVNARGLGRWKNYAEELAPLIEELEHAGSLEGWREAKGALSGCGSDLKINASGTLPYRPNSKGIGSGRQ